jgi:hypothetical protein
MPQTLPSPDYVSSMSLACHFLEVKCVILGALFAAFPLPYLWDG